MLNLIIKDIVIQKKTLLYAFLYSVFAPIFFSSIKPSGIGLYVLCPIVTTYFFITYAANYDDKNKSEMVLNSLPLKRSDIVISKYISIFVFVTIGIIYSTLIGCIGKTTGLAIFTGSISLLDIVLVLMGGCIFGAMFFPTYFKFGYVKTRIFNTILFMIIFFVPMNIINYVRSNPNNILVQKFNYFINNTSSLTQDSLALIIGLICFMISLMISIRIYNNKEF